MSDIGVTALNEIESPIMDLGQLTIKKLFPFIKIKDSTSVGRQGNIVNVPPFWATFRAEVPESVSYKDFLFSLQNAYPVVIYAHPKFRMTNFSIPNDTLYNDQFSLNSAIGINIDSAWNINTGENWVKVGVFDTGIDTTHEDLEVFTGWLSENDNTNSWGVDGDGHGTKVAGIIAARRNNTTGVAGIAGGEGTDTSGVRLIDFRNGVNNISDIEIWCISIINAARSPGSYYAWDDNDVNVESNLYYYYHNAPGYGIHVANHSTGFVLGDLGKTEEPPPINPGYPTLVPECYLCREAFLFSLQNGVTSVAARGNAPLNENPNSYVGSQIFPSANHDSWIISVGASGNNGERLIGGSNSSSIFFSPLGQDVDIIAPGSRDIIVTTKTNQLPGESYTSFEGTSAAAPHATGVAALLIGHYNKPCYSNINLDPADVEYVLQKSATQTLDNISSGGYDVGSGRLNAYEALKMLDFPEYQIVHPQDTFISRQTLEIDTILVYYRKPLNDFNSGPIGAFSITIIPSI